MNYKSLYYKYKKKYLEAKANILNGGAKTVKPYNKISDEYLLNIDNLYLLIMFFRLVLLIAVFSVAFANEFLSNARDNFRSLTKDHVSIATETSSIHYELNIISKS